ncbi:hypothetical protein [Klebsiella aerogenes]|uniref:hypothetical protein n=1 Tax=Klebsiella aerogenes TaxID=548 RepID=UPI002E34BE4B|nr:hypothetical protein [Klebsiella aerogenes]
MRREKINTGELNTVEECLTQLYSAEETIVDIERQLDQPLYNVEWKSKAEKALRTVKQKKRMITARLSVLRQHEKQHNIEQHKARNELLIHELKEIVTPSAFLNCVRRAEEKFSNFSQSLPKELETDYPESMHRMNMSLVNDVTAGKPLTITLPPLPVLGSTDEWYQGFAAGAGSMREDCASALTAAGLKVV